MTTTTDESEAAAIDALDRDLAEAGPAAMLDRLIATLDDRGAYRPLLDALLLRARHQLGMPAILGGPLASIPEPERSKYEDRYVEAIRMVGGKILATGDVLNAWPYFRVIGEKEPIARALEGTTPEPGDERVGHLIDVAFQQGVHPLRGFEWILAHYGICSAISAFEGLPQDDTIRTQAADRLARQLHEHLDANLRAEIGRRGRPLPAEGVPLRTLIAGKPWLFAEDAYHIDVSHLASVVRMSPLLDDPATIELAIGLTDYGRNLSKMHRYEGEPPFENLYEDHAVYLRARLGQGVDAALQHFRAKLGAGDGSELATAQMLVRMLVRLGRLDEAIDLAAEHLADLPDSMLACPSLAQLCQQAGRPDRLAKSARDRGDLVAYAAALLVPGS